VAGVILIPHCFKKDIMQYQPYIFLVTLLPLVVFIVLGLFGRLYLKNTAGAIGTASMFVSTIVSLMTAYNYFFAGRLATAPYREVLVIKYTWLQFSPGVSIDMGIVLDPISVMMIVVVSFVSLMVHLFSIGYMMGERRYSTYFAFLSLFTFSMLALVLSANLFQVYIFWELVGISSFLLIGFYFEKPAAVAAAKKAFIVTRFADFGFLVGILILAFYGQTLDISILVSRLSSAHSSQLAAVSTASFAGISLLTWALTLVFIGGAGKSAMFPLHIWLPDAMEGPTPVSALIHAATMVVAGVYLVARLFPVFSLDPVVLQIVTIVGASSAVLAAVIACAQSDIKRVLAYSTMSQIGYMMFALGIADAGGEDNPGFTGSMFHLFTHAFFKSLLFLCAGMIIHFVHSNDLKNMGGLRKNLPLTHLAFLIGCLAIAGIPPLAGFFSKEEILLAAYNTNKFVFAIGLITAGLTAFYMFRLYFSIFWNDQPAGLQVDGVVGRGNGEKSLLMKLPIGILSLCTIGAGFIPFSRFVTRDGVPVDNHTDLTFSIMPVLVSVVAIFIAAKLYRKQSEVPAKIASSLGSFYSFVIRKFYIDELYLFVTKKIIFNLLGRLAAWIDRKIVDGSVNGLATLTVVTSNSIKKVQSGRVQNYAFFFFAGIAVLTILFVYLLKE
jgi:NADH-quinone oxidoreductase subunit L